MQTIHLLWMLPILFLGMGSSAHAQEELTLASGAGFKRVIEQLSTAFSAKTGFAVQRVFGNMGQVTAQAKESDDIDFIIGDKSFLDATTLSFSEEHLIGKGKLVAAVAKGVAITSLNQVTDQAVTRIAIPDSKKAIYGHAATEYLTRTGVWHTIQPKLLVVGTLPQVTAYVVSGEVDMGFINLTEALAIKEKVGLILPVDETHYSPILIVAKRLLNSHKDKAAKAFVAFLQTSQALAIIQKHGM